MSIGETPSCAKCGIKAQEKACLVEKGKPSKSCPTIHQKTVLEKAGEGYSSTGIREFARQASIQEAQCYINRDAGYGRHPVKPRILEICEFAKKMEYKRLGFAYCGGLQEEAAAVNKILEAHGFEVISVICKVGCTPKEEIGIKEEQKVRIGQFETMCNPLGQAELLNREESDFNIIMGLCVGHDSLFFSKAQAPTTVLAVKDRLLGHNPLAAIYNLGSYYEWLWET